jgi:hypothetical protein
MQLKRLWRSLVSYGVVAALAIQFFSALSPAQVHASTLTLRFNELNWAGSQGHPTDEWIEFQNVSGAAIDFSSTPYTLNKVVAGVDQTIATLGAADGILPAGDFLVLTREMVGTSASSLSGGISGDHAIYIQKTGLDLPDMPTAYHLLDGANATVDSIDDAGQGIPFAGSLATSTEPTASMSRVTTSNDGNLPSSWYSTHTMGQSYNFAPTAALQFATPGDYNIEVASPSNVSIAPVDSTNDAALPVITGLALAGTAQVKAVFTRASFTPAPYSMSYNAVITGGNFMVTPTSAEIMPGRYLVDVSAYSAGGYRSAPVHITVAPATTEKNYVILPTSSVVPTPTLNAYNPATNQPTMMLSGAVGTSGSEMSYNSVEILRNGRYYGTIPMNADGMTFGTTVTLLPNMSNMFSFVAVNNAGTFSLPAVATIEQDLVNPNPVDVTKVVVHSNPTGTNDTLLGLPTAADPNTIVWIYGDAALTQPIGSVTVGSDGSFPEVSIGDNLYNRVYLVDVDAAGNRSSAVHVDNPTGYVAAAASGLNVSMFSIGDTQAVVSWTGVTGATSYRVKLRTAAGNYGSYTVVCATGNSGCSFQSLLVGMQPSTSYVVAVAAIDRFGTEGTYMERSFSTIASPLVVAPKPPAITTVSYVGGGTSTDSVSKAETAITPTPSPTPDAGDVKSASTDAARNWTPWIILLILIGIAILATAGYFYWFGGEAGEVAMAGAMDDEDEKPVTSTKSSTKKATDASSPPKKIDKDKRW